MSLKRSRTDFYPVVLIVGAGLVIALVLSTLYLLEQLQEAEDQPVTEAHVTYVGYDTPASPEGWRQLFNGIDLTGWEVTNFGPQGPVYVRDAAIVLSMGDGATGITWTSDFPVKDYEITLEAMRVDGNDFFCGLTFPVGDEFCTFVAGGWGGTLVGISSIDGHDAVSNFTAYRIPFNNNQWYKIRVRVDTESIHCYIDNELVVSVPVGDHSFSVRPEVGLSRPLGIATWVTTAALKNLRFRELE